MEQFPGHDGIENAGCRYVRSIVGMPGMKAKLGKKGFIRLVDDLFDWTRVTHANAAQTRSKLA